MKKMEVTAAVAPELEEAAEEPRSCRAGIDEQTGCPARPGPGSIVPGQAWPVVPPCRAAPGFVLGRRPRPGPWAYFRAGPAQMARPKRRVGPAQIAHKHMKISISQMFKESYKLNIISQILLSS